MSQSLFVCSAYTRAIVGHAEQSGLNSKRLLARAGICPSSLVDPARRIAAQAVERLWRECELAGAAPTFGCELVDGLATTGLQGLNILLDTAATLRVSLGCFVRFVPRISNHVQVELLEAGDFARLQLRPAQSAVHHFGLDAATCTLVRNIARRLGKPADAVFASVTLCPSQFAGQWLRNEGVAVEWGEYPQLTVHRAMLEEALPGANPFLHQSMLRHWHSEHCERDDSLTLARHWLTAGDQPIERIARRLGYGQPSNFIRAFRKRFGITPKQFRLHSGSGC